jgi:hypothetical protein
VKQPRIPPGERAIALKAIGDCAAKLHGLLKGLDPQTWQWVQRMALLRVPLLFSVRTCKQRTKCKIRQIPPRTSWVLPEKPPLPVLPLLETLSACAHEEARDLHTQKEARNGPRKHSEKHNLPLEALLLDLSVIFRSMEVRRYKGLCLDVAKLIHTWAHGRRTAKGWSVLEPEGTMPDWGESSWTRVQPDLTRRLEWLRAPARGE